MKLLLSQAIKTENGVLKYTYRSFFITIPCRIVVSYFFDNLILILKKGVFFDAFYWCVGHRQRRQPGSNPG